MLHHHHHDHVLWQLQISHYVEKVRWALDANMSRTSAARYSRGATPSTPSVSPAMSRQRRCSRSTTGRSGIRRESSPRSRSAGRSRRCIPKMRRSSVARSSSRS
jgi:hypothetical protein